MRANGRCRPSNLAARHNLPPRHLEPVLQALVHEGILKGIRGPRGGYELARERKRITCADILRAAGTRTTSDRARNGVAHARTRSVLPAVAQAERAFSAALARINLDDIARRAEPLRERS